jgi:PAS domain S-box-containing protein
MSDLSDGAPAGPRLTPEYVAALVFAESKTMAEATPRVLQAICEELGWDFAALWMVDGASDVLRCVETWHRSTAPLSEFDASTRCAVFNTGVGLPGRVWASAQPAWIPDVLADPNFPRAPMAYHEGLHAAFALPLINHGTVIGVMEFFSRAIREPDGPLLAMLARVGEQICGFMERKKADEELDRFFALSPDLMCVAGFNGYFKRLNPAWERVLGYTREELLAQPYLEFVHPDDRHPTATEADRLSVGGQVLKFENRYRSKDGRYRWLEWTAVPYPDEQVIYAAARDITERKAAKETIARYSRDLKAAREAEAANASRLSRLVNELEVRDLLNVVKGALQASNAPQTIDVMSAVPKWVELMVPCTRAAADEIHQVIARLSADLPQDVVDSVSYAFRELLLNAVEWGGKLDPSRQVRITCVRTDRVLIYRIADPGQGFTFSELEHAAVSHVDDPLGHVRVREEKHLRPGGFGILTARANIDELVYNEKQNEVIFMKYLDQRNETGP